MTLRMEILIGDRIYNSFSLEFEKETGPPRFDIVKVGMISMYGEFSADQICGMFIVSNLIGRKLRRMKQITQMKQKCVSGNTIGEILNTGGGYHYDKFISRYLVEYADDINEGKNLPIGKYGLWIIEDVGYELIMFDTPEFLQGFITIANAFQVDYREYIVGNVFKYDELGNKTEYMVEL